MENTKINIINLEYGDYLQNTKHPYLTVGVVIYSSDIYRIYIQISKDTENPSWIYYDECIDENMTNEELIKELELI